MRTNILIRKYSHCSVLVKTALFKSFCLCLYDTALRKKIIMCTMNKLKSAYNKCIHILYGYRRNYSVTEMLYEPNLPNCDTLLHNGATGVTLCVMYVRTVLKHICSVLFFERF